MAVRVCWAGKSGVRTREAPGLEVVEMEWWGKAPLASLPLQTPRYTAHYASHTPFSPAPGVTAPIPAVVTTNSGSDTGAEEANPALLQQPHA